MTKNYWEQRIFRIAAACLLLGLTAQTNLDEPFGLSTVTSLKGPLSANWNDLQSQINLEQAVVAQCRGEANLCSSRAAASFVAILNQGEQHNGIARIGHINRAINLAIQGRMAHRDHCVLSVHGLVHDDDDAQIFSGKPDIG